MLIIEKNSVYEIDEECLKKKRVPAECEVYKRFANRQNETGEKENKRKAEPVRRGRS